MQHLKPWHWLFLWLSLVWFSLSHATTSIPGFELVKAQHRASEVQWLDRSGQLLQTQRVDWQRRQGKWLDIDQVSPALVRVLLHAEDRRFYEHEGVDWYAVAGTAWSSLWGQRLRGTSTISMQLVDLLGLGSGRVVGQRSWSAKWEQARLAQQLESSWTKTQILEAYLNRVPFKGELVGVDAMARVLWQKQAFALTLPEAALAVAMLPSPNAQPFVLQQRSCALWRGIQPQADCATQQAYNRLALQRLVQPAWGNPNQAPHWGRYVAGTTPSVASMQTSVDGVLQQQGQAIIHHHLSDLRRSNANDAALLVLDNVSGQVLAYVGSSTYSHAEQFDHVQAKRQAGSTLKPFLYQLALEQQRITAASLLADTSAQFSTPYGMYVPQNYDERFMGWVSARVALAGSINIPAVRLVAQVGVDTFQQYLQRLGFDLPHAADHYGLGLALGGVEVSLWQLTNAYRSLARLGAYSEPCVTLSCESSASIRVADKAASWITQQLLADNTARAITFGLDSALDTPFWTAVKTGTSKDMRDNWTVGFSERYTVGVWVGNTDGTAMHQVSGISGAAPIWHDVMRFLHQTVASHSPLAPDQVVCQSVRFVNHFEPSRKECFIAGTQRSQVVLEGEASVAARIVTPLHEAIYALDPDIPSTQQQLTLQAQLSTAKPIVWRIDGDVVSTEREFHWIPRPGKHVIELIDQQSLQRLDTITIDIRG